MIYKFSQAEVSLMEFLGHKTDMDKAMCYEGWEEAKWEQVANGLPYNKSFREYLEARANWESSRRSLQEQLKKATV